MPKTFAILLLLPALLLVGCATTVEQKQAQNQDIGFVEPLAEINDSGGAPDIESVDADMNTPEEENTATDDCSGSEDEDCDDKAAKTWADVDMAEEVTFDKPIDIVWTGDPYFYMMNNSAYALKRIPADETYPLFYASEFEEIQDEEGIFQPKYTGKIEITGKWVGITCAYYGVFNHQCVPDVEVEKVREVK